MSLWCNSQSKLAAKDNNTHIVFSFANTHLFPTIFSPSGKSAISHVPCLIFFQCCHFFHHYLFPFSTL
ncbi:hypothetical protein Lalb_Chr06g0172511 [Lupinus albus]|uniref:Uncharacterized protein n=1 Tax=Lupinus albus TaxID=3870 RepID=A0A6A4QEB2_LUPAL|nr:hypothetical protein Lalb_Chr06g0172511 [Lupinus albus]